jgi:hypothetical protein
VEQVLAPVGVGHGAEALRRVERGDGAGQHVSGRS